MKIFSTKHAVLCAAVLLASWQANAQTSSTRAQLESNINAEITTNGTGQITGAILNKVLQDQAASTATLLDANSLPLANLQNITGPSLLGSATSGSTPVSTVPLASAVATALGIAPNAAGGFVSVPNTDSCVYQNSASAVAGCTIPNSTLQFDGSGKLGIDLATPNTWTALQALPGLPGLTDSFQFGGQGVNGSGLVSTLSAAGSGSAGSANQSGWGLSTTMASTSSAANYQKNGFAAFSTCSDPSQYTPSQITRDCVGLYSGATATVDNDRVWSFNTALNNDGHPTLMTGWECDLTNTYQNEHTGSTTDSSVCAIGVPQGTFDITTGFLLANNGVGFGKFFDGYVMAGGATGGRAFLVSNAYGSGEADFFSVGNDGLVTANDSIIVGTASFQALSSGQGNFTGNSTYGAALYGKGGTADVALFNKNQSLAAYVPTGTTNFEVVSNLIFGGSVTGSGAFTANGTTALSLTNIGPSGAHSTVQKWFTVSDGTNTFYIPAF